MLDNSLAASYVSCRGLQHGSKPFFRYVPALMTALKDIFHPIDNPEGYIITTLSENTQMAQEMEMKLSQRPLITFSKLQLGDFNGSSELRGGIRKLIKREISTNIELNDDHILCLSGATACMTAAACALFNFGETLLILSPCYPGFFNDFSVPADVHCVFVPMSHPDYKLDFDRLEAAHDKSAEDGHKPRAIIITNPSNPTGLCYSKEELTTLLRWVRRKRLFYISNEVYGTTCYDTTCCDNASESIDPTDSNHSCVSRQPDCKNHQYVSIIDVAYEEAKLQASGEPIDLSNVLGNDVQILWSASKDLGLSGLRVGVSICQNLLVHAAMGRYGISSQISREAQSTVAFLLNDEDWITEHFISMRAKLHQGSKIVQQTLFELNIPYIKPLGGLFIWFDLSEFLPLYYYKQQVNKRQDNVNHHQGVTFRQTKSEEENHEVASSTALSSPQSPSGSIHSCTPTEEELNEAEWMMFEDLFFSYKLGLTPGTDFVPPLRNIEVPALGCGRSTTWRTASGFMRSCFGSVPLPLIPLAMDRLRTFITDRRRETQQIMGSLREI